MIEEIPTETAAVARAHNSIIKLGRHASLLNYACLSDFATAAILVGIPSTNLQNTISHQLVMLSGENVFIPVL